MLEKGALRINSEEVEQRFKDAQNKLREFKDHVNQALESYKNSFSYRLRLWLLGKKTSDPDARHQNIIEIEQLLAQHNTATALADALAYYLEGPIEHFSWAWFSPLRSLVLEALENTPTNSLAAIDRDLKLGSYVVMAESIIQLPEHTSTSTSSSDNTLTALQHALASTKQALCEATKKISTQQQQLDSQQDTLDSNNTLIETLSHNIQSLTEQLSTFKLHAENLVKTLRTKLATLVSFIKNPLAGFPNHSAAVETDSAFASSAPETAASEVIETLNAFDQSLVGLDASLMLDSLGTVSIDAAATDLDEDIQTLFANYTKTMQEILSEQQAKTAAMQSQIDQKIAENQQLQTIMTDLSEQLMAQRNARQTPAPDPPAPIPLPASDPSVDQKTITALRNQLQQRESELALIKAKLAAQESAPALLTSSAPEDASIDQQALAELRQQVQELSSELAETKAQLANQNTPQADESSSIPTFAPPPPPPGPPPPPPPLNAPLPKFFQNKRKAAPQSASTDPKVDLAKKMAEELKEKLRLRSEGQAKVFVTPKKTLTNHSPVATQNFLFANIKARSTAMRPGKSKPDPEKNSSGDELNDTFN